MLKIYPQTIVAMSQTKGFGIQKSVLNAGSVEYTLFQSEACPLGGLLNVTIMSGTFGFGAPPTTYVRGQEPVDARGRWAPMVLRVNDGPHDFRVFYANCVAGTSRFDYQNEHE